MRTSARATAASTRSSGPPAPPARLRHGVVEREPAVHELRAQTEHPIYHALGRAKRIYWDIYQDKAPVPAGLTLFNYPI